jgi:hypothetical protein
MNKTLFTPILSGIAGVIIGFFPIYLSSTSQIDDLKSSGATLTTANEALKTEISSLGAVKTKAETLEAELSRISLKSASGGGVNLKLMLHPETKKPTVPMNEVFSFDANHAFCRVDTNHEAFIMPTFKMGDVLIEKNEFYMAMSTTSIDEFKISKDSDGKNRITITGDLDCFTEVAKAKMKLGSREVAEVAGYKIKAIDGGPGGGPSGDSFEFTVYFDPETAPVNYGVFGPEFTFTGDMVDGEITIADPR